MSIGELSLDKVSRADAQPARGFHRPAGVEPFGRLQPVAELPRILVNPEMLQHQAQRAHRRMVLGKLVVIEISPLRRMLAAHIHHRGGRIRQIRRRRLAPDQIGTGFSASNRQQARNSSLCEPPGWVRIREKVMLIVGRAAP